MWMWWLCGWRQVREQVEQSGKFKKKVHHFTVSFGHPAAVWQKTQERSLQHHQTTEQLLSSGCEAPELILNTPPLIIYAFWNDYYLLITLCSFCFTCVRSLGECNKDVIMWLPCPRHNVVMPKSTMKCRLISGRRHNMQLHRVCRPTLNLPQKQKQ